MSDSELAFALQERVAELEVVLTAILDYPDIREYIGTLLYNNGREALGKKYWAEVKSY